MRMARKKVGKNDLNDFIGESVFSRINLILLSIVSNCMVSKADVTLSPMLLEPSATGVCYRIISLYWVERVDATNAS